MPESTEWLDQILKGEASTKIRDAASRGLLPFGPTEMLRSLSVLSREEDETIRSQALETTRGLPRSLLIGAASDQITGPEILSYIHHSFAGDEELMVILATNPGSGTEVLNALAGSPMVKVLETLGRNQERLRQEPGLMDRLLENAGFPDHLRGYLLEEQKRQAAPVQAPMAGLEFEEEEVPEKEFHEVLVKEYDEEDGKLTFEKRKAVEVERRKSIYQLVREMNVGEKLVLATRGNKEARMILIREANKQVAIKVLEGPRVSDAEAEAYAKMTNVNDDVLRAIAKNREWIRKYGILKALAFNPKTPVGVSLPLVSKLSIRNLKFMGRNRNIPEVIRRTAVRLFKMRSEKKKG
jgi:hypothetical protein